MTPTNMQPAKSMHLLTHVKGRKWKVLELLLHSGRPSTKIANNLPIGCIICFTRKELQGFSKLYLPYNNGSLGGLLPTLCLSQGTDKLYDIKLYSLYIDTSWSQTNGCLLNVGINCIHIKCIILKKSNKTDAIGEFGTSYSSGTPLVLVRFVLLNF